MSRRHAALVIALIAVVVGLGLQRVDDNGPHQKAIVRASAAAGAAISVDGRPARSIPDLVWCPKSNLKKFRMDFVPRQGARRSHSRAMATPSNEALGAKDAEIIQGIFGTPH